MSYSIDIKDEVSAAVRGVADGLRGGRANPVMGHSVAERVQQNFQRLNSERANKLGGARTNFYAQADRSTQFQSGVDSFTVSVNQVGIRQRLEGGTIKPVKAKYLTLPAIAEAYGKRAREFSNLVVVYGRGRQPVALAEAQATAVRKKGGKGKSGYRSAGSLGGRVFFWLLKSVTQRPDPSVMPTVQELIEAALDAAGRYFRRLAERRSES